MSVTCDVIAFFSIYGPLAAMRKLDYDGWSIKFTFSLIVTFYLTFFNIYNLLSFYLLSTALSKGTIFAKKVLIFWKKDASISKIKDVLVVNVYFLRLQCVCTYVPNFKFLAWFWQLLKGVILSPLQKKKNKLGLSYNFLFKLFLTI